VLPAGSSAAITTLAIQLCGRAVVHLNYTAGKERVAAAIASASVSQVVTSRQFSRELSEHGIELHALLPDTAIFYIEDIRRTIPAWRKPLVLTMFYLLPARWFYRLQGQNAAIDDPAAIQFSGSDDAVQRAVVLSHRNIVSNSKQISDVLNTRMDDVIMSSLPPSNPFGFTVTTIMPLIEGIPMVCHPLPVDTLGIARGIARARATILFATPGVLAQYIGNAEVQPLMLDSLRVVVTGGERLPEDVRRAFELKFGKRIYEGYGTTETSPVATVNIPDAMDTTDWKVQQGNVPGSVGMPLPGTSIKIVAPQTLEELPLGEAGLILISGSQVMPGYLGDAQATARVISERDGGRWFRSDDTGYLTEEGFLVIT